MIYNHKLHLKILVAWAFLVAVVWAAGQGGLAGVLAISAPLGYWFGWKRSKRQTKTHGSAHWAGYESIAARGLFARSGVIVGRYGKDLIRFNQPGHLATFAPTRTGKGTGQIIPTLLEYGGSVFVTDIKRENYDITHKWRRRMGQSVYAIDPERPDTSAIFNPLDYVRLDRREIVTDAAVLADLLVPRSSVGASQHFDNQAYMLIQGLIMFAKTQHPETASLAMVREMLTADRDTFEAICETMAGDTQYPKIAETGNAILKLSERERASVISTANGKTEIWSDEKIKAVTSGRSTFDFKAMKTDPITVYMVIPPEHLSIYKSFMRAVVGMANLAMTQNKAAPKDDVLFLLDEFPALGHMDAFETGIGVVAGYGVKYWIFCQDMAQLRANYRDKWESMLGNCAVRSFFGTTDYGTAENISKTLGKATIRTKSKSYAVEAGGLVASSAGASETEQYRELMTPDEITAMDFKEQIIMVQGMRPIMAEKAFYYQVRKWRKRCGKWEGA